MSFLFPLFLLAGLTIVLPILIHLFNLRRYKTVLFPHTWLLKNLQLHSQKQSKVRYKWLLAARILFLLLLVLAFAQPFLKNNTVIEASKTLQVIYLDNSASMTAKNGVRTLLDVAKEKATTLLRAASPDSRFILLTNDKTKHYQPQSIDQTLATLQSITMTASTKSVTGILQEVQSMMQAEALPTASVYYYSDFQKSGFTSQPNQEVLQNISFYGVPIQADKISNVYIDTAVLTTPVLQTGTTNKLIVTTKYSGASPKELPSLQLSINGQVKSASTIHFNDKKESIDTLNFQVNEAGWQQIAITLNDAIRFDDTFRIAARSNNNLSVLILNENQRNPFIDAAFHAYEGFRYDNRSIQDAINWNPYNLIILNGFTQLPTAIAKRIKGALQQGQSIALFPGKTTQLQDINEGLSLIAPIQFTGMDMEGKTATSLQTASELASNIFDRIPDNIQLPQATWHYQLSARLDANQQSIISFRNGEPLLAQFAPSNGKLYLLTTSADLQGGNFTTSYFFVPFLYQMAAQSGNGNVYALPSGSDQPLQLSFPYTGERSMVHVYQNNIDLIPPQRKQGAGVGVFLGKVLTQPGFYALAAGGTDTVQVAINTNRKESILDNWTLEALEKQWSGNHITWVQPNKEVATLGNSRTSQFPIWKICVLFALILLGLETFLLTRNLRIAEPKNT